MRKVLLLSAMLATAVLFAPAAKATPSTYEFSGICGDCNGMSHALLTLNNYTPGTSLKIANFVHFEYYSNLLSLTVDSSQVANIAGVIPVGGGPANLFIDFNVPVGSCASNCAFASNNQAAFGHSWFIAQDDFGTGGTFSSALFIDTPEPGSIAMLASGIGALALLRRKRRA